LSGSGKALPASEISPSFLTTSAAHGCRIASEPGSPVACRQHHGFGSARCVVRPGEHAPQHRLRPEHRQDGIGREERPHFFRLREAGHAHGAGVPQSQILEHPAVLTVGEVEERRSAGARDLDARCGVVEHDQLVRLRIRQRLQEHALNDAEHGSVGADPNREGQHRHGRKARHPGETADDLLQTHAQAYGRTVRRVAVWPISLCWRRANKKRPPETGDLFLSPYYRRIAR